MGNTQHSKVQEEKKIIANPQEGRASDFYWACHNGDIELVKSMVPHIPYAELNQLEPNGSTPLHAASFYCHTEVVHFLLHECGVRRHRLNRYGLTAFEEAQTDEIKELYRRKSNRFNDEKENVSDIFEVLSVESGELNSDDIESSDEDDSSDHTTAVPSKWIQPYRTTDEIEEEKYYYRKGKALIQSKIGRFIMRNGPKYCAHCRRNKDVMSEFISYFNDRTFRVNKLREIVDEVVNPEDCAYNKCHQLLDEYLDDGNVESLLTLYTFQTGFYEKVKTCCQAVSWSLYIILPDLKDRFYCGKTYRGVMMTEKDLDAYRSAIKHPDSLVKTKTLSSSSIDRFEAEKFLSSPRLLHFLGAAANFFSRGALVSIVSSILQQLETEKHRDVKQPTTSDVPSRRVLRRSSSLPTNTLPGVSSHNLTFEKKQDADYLLLIPIQIDLLLTVFLYKILTRRTYFETCGTYLTTYHNRPNHIVCWHKFINHNVSNSDINATLFDYCTNQTNTYINYEYNDVICVQYLFKLINIIDTTTNVLAWHQAIVFIVIKSIVCAYWWQRKIRKTSFWLGLVRYQRRMLLGVLLYPLIAIYIIIFVIILPAYFVVMERRRIDLTHYLLYACLKFMVATIAHVNLYTLSKWNSLYWRTNLNLTEDEEKEIRHQPLPRLSTNVTDTKCLPISHSTAPNNDSTCATLTEPGEVEHFS
ncbi:unnamed protein product [Adineta steineri]|uniref:Uncharacterized protein n=1 Tax=Adineta steineri TaxID=433720 RepID=A0A818YAK1_9BILA|nr:unnamed protein product [Adineta steineri]CAF3751249.1 unnamed protein product [Adineta steineri]